MSDPGLGLSRREMERELSWMLRNIPADPKELARLLSKSFVSLIEKNNARIAADLAKRDELDDGGDF